MKRRQKRRYPPLRGSSKEKQLFQRRSALSRAIDRALYAPAPPDRKTWRKYPNRYDLINIDSHSALVRSRGPVKREYVKRDLAPERKAVTLRTAGERNKFLNRISRMTHGDVTDKIDWRSELDPTLEPSEMLRILQQRRASAFKRNQEMQRPTRPNRELERKPVDPYIRQAVYGMDVRNLPPLD